MKLLSALLVVWGIAWPGLPVSAAPTKKTGQATAQPAGRGLKVEFQKFTLPNGLDVIFHIDRSDPVVAVNLTAHVGSAREKAGRTGFAHLFEHLLFLESENLGKGGLDKMTARIGGSGANGSTSHDRTNYLQTVPKDALEKMIWAEADKLGWFINTVTDQVLAKEKQVVKNEKRQRVDNAPYGHTQYVINKALYPQEHPYNWQVIGSLEDLQNATVDDVKEFFRRWYVPNNVALVLAGDFDPVQAKKWVEKYFAEIKRGDDIKPIPKKAGEVRQTLKFAHEDNFARLPELTMVWPTVEDLHPDSYALEVLGEYLTKGKKAPFYKVLVEDKKLTAAVRAGHYTGEVAGQLQFAVRAFEGKNLNEVASAINAAFAHFEKDGISEKDLNRIKVGQETNFYNSLASVLGKSAQLAQYNYMTGNPGYVEQDIQHILAVTPQDVMRVYEKYIKGKNYVATSFVPRGKLDLALEGSQPAAVVEEKILQGAEAAVDPNINATWVKTPSSIERSKEPPYGKPPVVKIPPIWESKLGNGLRVMGIENNEVPLVQFELVIEGGQLLDDINKVGVANLMARLMNQGSQNKTPQEMEEAIQQLGATIRVSARSDDVRIQVNTLARNYQATLALVEEMLLQPRWDEKEFALLKQNMLNQIRQQEADPNQIANNHFNLLIYGKDNIRSRNLLGSMDSVNSITIDDLKTFYRKNISPSLARVLVVGALPKAAMMTSLNRLNSQWKPFKVALPAAAAPGTSELAKVYFVDVPDAKQSVLQIGFPALAATDKDYYPATVMNYILGGGGFASRLTQQLREGKGYTYGIRSEFNGNKHPGEFTIAGGVRTNVTLESAQLVKQILQEFGDSYTAADLATTQGFLVKSNARAFETAAAKLGMLEEMSEYGWKPGYIQEREQIVKTMTVEKIRALSKKYLDPNKMIWLVVGDAKTQLPRMKELGFGEPVLLKK